MTAPNLPGILEAILFVSGEPVSLQEIAAALETTAAEVLAAAESLSADYDLHLRGLCLKRFGNSVQLATRLEYAGYIEKLL